MILVFKSSFVILPSKGFWRRMVNSPEGGGAMERGIVIYVKYWFRLLVLS